MHLETRDSLLWNGIAPTGLPPAPLVVQPPDPRQEQLLEGLRAVQRGDFNIRLSTTADRGLMNDIANAFNALVSINEAMAREILRVARVVGRDGRMAERATLGPTASGECYSSGPGF